MGFCDDFSRTSFWKVIKGKAFAGLLESTTIAQYLGERGCEEVFWAKGAFVPYNPELHGDYYQPVRDWIRLYGATLSPETLARFKALSRPRQYSLLESL